MNDQVLEQARGAYRAGDFATAAQLFAGAKAAGEVAGEVDHLRGNSLMRLGRYADAADAYAAALSDAAYGKRGALLTNRGKALMAAGDVVAATEAFGAATQDGSYATRYKAYMGLGDALKAQGQMTEAGVAYRQAAIDDANPARAAALTSLGDCFMALGRPQDATEVYRTALDFAGPRDDARAINAALGCAYAAQNRFSDAVDAFGRSMADGIYQLSPDQAAEYDRARDALAANASMAMTAPGYADGVDPLDPLGQSGNFMPDPSDTGFFTLTEHEMVQQERQDMKVRRKHRHTGLKVFIVVLVLLVIALGGAGFAYTQGFGIPSQQDAVSGLFEAVSNGDDPAPYLASELDESARSMIASSIPVEATPSIEGLDKSMTTSTATVKATLERGGEMTYKVDFVRNGLGWVVSAVTADFGDTASDASTAE